MAESDQNQDPNQAAIFIRQEKVLEHPEYAGNTSDGFCISPSLGGVVKIVFGESAHFVIMSANDFRNYLREMDGKPDLEDRIKVKHEIISKNHPSFAEHISSENKPWIRADMKYLLELLDTQQT